jgi:hypothetical protein
MTESGNWHGVKPGAWQIRKFCVKVLGSAPENATLSF